MKKNYIAPSTYIAILELQQMIAASDSITSTGDVTDITYGGSDTDGSKDPSSRRRSQWDDEEEEEY